jgi:hypothetical protein
MATRNTEFVETMVEVLPLAGELEEEPMLSRYFTLEQLTWSELARKKASPTSQVRSRSRTSSISARWCWIL